MNTTWSNGRESRGCEQTPPRSNVVSVQQHMALHDTAVITLPHISLCGRGGPRSPSLLQGKFSSKGMELWRYVQYHLPKQELPLHVVIGSPRRRSAADTQLVHPHRLYNVQTHSPPLVPPLARDMQNSWLYLRLPFHGVATCTVVSSSENDQV